MKDKTAGGDDGIPPEVYKAVPFIDVQSIGRLFKERQKGTVTEGPPNWKLINYIGLPKGVRADSLDLYRWIVRQVLFLASRWGRSLLVGALDVAIAFDSIDHGKLSNALLQRRLHHEQVRCLLRELTGMMANSSSAGAGTTGRFLIEKGGKQ